MCSVCNGAFNCPSCSDEPDTERCPNCAGTGNFYFNADGDPITSHEYGLLPKGKREMEECPVCNGEGEILADDDDFEEEFDYDF